MKQLTFFAIFVTCLGSNANTTELSKEYNDFLVNVGFKNYSEQLEDSGNYLGDKSKQVLREQTQTYQVFNHARELAVEIMLSLYERNDPKGKYFLLGKNLPEAQQDLVTFTARMLNFRPLAGATNEVQIKKHVQLLMSDVLEVLYDKDKVIDFIDVAKQEKESAQWLPHLERLQKVRGLLTKLVSFAYQNSEMGQAPYLGRALAAGLAKYSQRENLPKLFTQDLRTRVAQEGLSVANYVGDTLKLLDKNGRLREVKLENGDFLYQKSVDAAPVELSYARPAEVNEYFAQRFDLLGSPLTIHQPRTPADDASAQSNLAEWMKDKVVKYGFADRGLNHIGMAVQFTDPTTKISLFWAVDNYPNKGHGGIRITDIVGQFARPEDSIRLGVSRYDPIKFYSFAKKYRARNGFREKVWESDEEEKKSPEDKVDKVFWTATDNQKEEMEAMFKDNLDPANAKEWYTKFILKVTDHLTNHMLYRGLAYIPAWGNVVGSAYDASTLVIASLQSTGIDLQSFHDRWHPLVIKNKAVDPNQRVIAAAGILWQGDLTEEASLAIVQYRRFSEKERSAQKTLASFKPMNPKSAEKFISDADFEKLTIED